MESQSTKGENIFLLTDKLYFRRKLQGTTDYIKMMRNEYVANSVNTHTLFQFRSEYFYHCCLGTLKYGHLLMNLIFDKERESQEETFSLF